MTCIRTPRIYTPCQDPCDPPVLKEGEVHIKIDKANGRFVGCASEDVIRGDVLVSLLNAEI